MGRADVGRFAPPRISLRDESAACPRIASRRPGPTRPIPSIGCRRPMLKPPRGAGRALPWGCRRPGRAIIGSARGWRPRVSDAEPAALPFVLPADFALARLMEREEPWGWREWVRIVAAALMHLALL